jgi:hypothetical protein
VHPVADVQSLEAALQPALHGGTEDPHPGALFGGAGDDAVERLADAAGQEERRGRLAHLPLDLVGVVLLQGAAPGDLGQLLGVIGRGAAGQGGLQEAVGDEVGVAPVGGSRVGVVAHGEAEVARRLVSGEVDRVLARSQELDHRERHLRKALGVRRPAFLQESGEGAGVGLRRQPLAEAGGDLDDAPPALGGTDDTAQRGEALLLEEAGDDAVGGDHEVLDQLLGRVLAVLAEVAHRVAVEDRPRLDRLELQGAVLEAELAQPLGGLALQARLLVRAGRRRHGLRHRPRAVEPGGHRVVGELGVVVHPGGVDVGRGERAVGGDRHLDDHGEAVLSRVEGGEVGRQSLGEHRKDPRRGVDGGGVVPRMVVDRRAVAHQGVHVGHGDQHLDPAVGRGFRHGELVQISGVVVVDRDPEEPAQVAYLGIAAGRGGELPGFGHGRGGEVGQEAALFHGAAGDGLEVGPLTS